MSKSLCAFIALSLLSFPFYGQNKKAVDSLLQITESNISSSEKVDAYLKVAFEHVGSDSTGANFYVTKAIKIADSIGYEEGKMDALYILCRSSMLSGDYVLSQKYLEQLVNKADQLQYPRGKANAFYAKAWLSYYSGKYEESIANHLKSLEIRRTLENKIDVSDCLRGIGISYKLQGEFDQALKYLSESLEIEKSVNNQGGMAITLNHIGIINGLRGDHSSAMDIYFQALDILEALDDKSGLAYTLQNIGVIYDQQMDYDKALDYYHRSLSLRKEIGERRGIAQIMSNTGNVYHKLNNYDKALEQYGEALRIKQSLGDQRGVADGHLNVGKLYADQGRHEEAIANKLKSLEISTSINSDWGKVKALISLGRSYQDVKRYAEAKEYLLEGIALARESMLIENVREGTRHLSIVERELGHFKEAYEAQILHQQMSDSLLNIETTKRITLLEAEYKFQQEKDSIQFANEREKLILDERIKNQRSVQFAMLIVVVVLVVVLVVLLRYYRLKNESNRRLSELNDQIHDRNESLRSLNEEKNNLISIVAHDLQNPLSGIIGAVNLMDSSEMKEDQKKLKGLIELSSTRMSKMISEILDVEAIEKNADEINVQPYNLSTAIHQVCNQFSKQASDKKIEIKTFVEEDVRALVDERYAVQIIENLLSNAIKFSPKNKEIEVHLSNTKETLILEVKDQGQGLSEVDKKKLFRKFQRLSAKPTANERSTGLGLSIVKKYVERMGGKIWCESELGKGASFFVELQLVREMI